MGWGAWKQAGVALKLHLRADIWFYNPEAERGRDRKIGKGESGVLWCVVGF